MALSAAALRASARATEARLGGPGRWLLALPAEHVAGVQVIVRALLAGAPPVVMDLRAGFRPDAFAAATAALGPGRRYTSLVPTQLRRILDAEGRRAGAAAQLRGRARRGCGARPGDPGTRAGRRGASRHDLRHERDRGRVRLRRRAARRRHGRARRPTGGSCSAAPRWRPATCAPTAAAPGPTAASPGPAAAARATDRAGPTAATPRRGGDAAHAATPADAAPGGGTGRRPRSRAAASAPATSAGGGTGGWRCSGGPTT